MAGVCVTDKRAVPGRAGLAGVLGSPAIASDLRGDPTFVGRFAGALGLAVPGLASENLGMAGFFSVPVSGRL